MHCLKLLELVSIERTNNKNYLHIKFSFEDDMEFLWAIDTVTADSLDNEVDCDGSYKYRLSLSSTYDHVRNQFVSSLTKTYREYSETIYFDCSVEYKDCLERIKNSPSMTEIGLIPSVYIDYPHNKDESTMPVQNVKEVKKRIKSNLSLLVAIIVLLLVTNDISSYNPVHKATIDTSIVTAAQPQMTITPVNFTIEENLHISDTTLLTNDSTSSNFPSITTDDSVTYSIPKGNVALTFDDGPSKNTKAIADILLEYNVGGTFFFLGSNAKHYPDSVRYVLDHGYAVGNHTYSHADLTKLTVDKQENEILQASKVIEDITHQEIVLFRPPYGALNDQITALVESYSYKVVQWNRDPKDWQTDNPDDIINYILHNDASGSIIILHESQTVVDALPKVIEILKERNLNIVNLQ